MKTQFTHIRARFPSTNSPAAQIPRCLCTRPVRGHVIAEAPAAATCPTCLRRWEARRAARTCLAAMRKIAGAKAVGLKRAGEPEKGTNT